MTCSLQPCHQLPEPLWRQAEHPLSPQRGQRPRGTREGMYRELVFRRIATPLISDLAFVPIDAQLRLSAINATGSGFCAFFFTHDFFDEYHAKARRYDLQLQIKVRARDLCPNCLLAAA